MHYGHSIKYRYYFDGIFNFNIYTKLGSSETVLFCLLKCMNISGMNIEKIFEILRNPTVYSLYRAKKQRDSVVFKCINISDINIEKIFVYVSSTTVQTRVQCVQRKLYQILRESICIKACQNCYINTAITVKLLKSRVTLLNTCEKLKMTHETTT
jgi:hypothetical protein